MVEGNNIIPEQLPLVRLLDTGQDMKCTQRNDEMGSDCFLNYPAPMWHNIMFRQSCFSDSAVFLALTS
jgi:hypothetical protein